MPEVQQASEAQELGWEAMAALAGEAEAEAADGSSATNDDESGMGEDLDQGTLDALYGGGYFMP